MIGERPSATVERFIHSWNSVNTNPSRLVAEIKSLYNETNRYPDNYHFNVKDARLIDPETGRPILEFIAPGLEMEIARKLESWASTADEGIAYWISPKLKGLYPCNKIIIHQIAYDLNGNKVVLNSAILFDGDIKSPEEIRKILFTAPDNNDVLINILSWIEKLSGEKIKKSDTNKNLTIEATDFARQIMTNVDPKTIVKTMLNSGFLGNNPISCPLSFSNHASIRSFIFLPKNAEGGKFVKKCGNCGIDINDFISAGYVCKNCGGVYKGC